MAVLQREYQRYFDPFEEALYDTIGTTTLTTEYRGSIDLDAFRRAFAVLSVRHPVLRSRVRTNECGHALEVLPEYVAETAEVIGGKSELFREAASLKANLRPKMAQLLVVHNEENDKGYVVLAMDHAIVDGHAAFTYIAELWKLYAKIAHGQDFPSPEPGDLPKGPSEILKRRWIELDSAPWDEADPLTPEGREHRTVYDIPKRTTRTDFTPRHQGSGWRKWPVRRELIKLNLEELRRLRGISRSNDITVGGALIGTLLATLRDREDAAGPVSMKVAVAVDLRNSVDPPIGPTETTDLAAIVGVRLEVNREPDPVELARTFNAQLGRMINPRSMRYLMDSSLSPDLVAEMHYRHAHDSCVTYNNGGIVPRFVTPPNVEVMNLLTDPGVDPSEEGEVIRRDLPVPHSIVPYTFGDNLSIIWGEPDECNGSIKNRFLMRLRDVMTL